MFNHKRVSVCLLTLGVACWAASLPAAMGLEICVLGIGKEAAGQRDHSRPEHDHLSMSSVQPPDIPTMKIQINFSEITLRSVQRTKKS